MNMKTSYPAAMIDRLHDEIRQRDERIKYLTERKYELEYTLIRLRENLKDIIVEDINLVIGDKVDD